MFKKLKYLIPSLIIIFGLLFLTTVRFKSPALEAAIREDLKRETLPIFIWDLNSLDRVRVLFYDENPSLILKDADIIKKIHKANYLELKGQLNQNILDTFSKIKVSHLDLNNTTAIDQTLINPIETEYDISVFIYPNEITYLSMTRVNAKRVSGFKNLTGLYIDFNLTNFETDNEFYFDPSKIYDLPSIRGLNMVHCNLTNDDILKLPRMSNYGGINLSNNHITSMENLMKLGIESINSISLRANDITEILSLDSLGPIEDLDLKRNKTLNPDSIVNLGDNVTTLDVENCNFTYIDLTNVKIPNLYMSNNNISEVIVSQKNHYIETLYLSDNPIEDYEPFFNLRKLADLSVDGILGRNLTEHIKSNKF